MNARDAISLINDICTYLTSGNPIWRNEPIIDACRLATKALEQYELDWILCKEQLPEKEGRYLVWAIVSFETFGGGRPCEYQETSIASFFKNEKSHHWHGDHIKKVIAWRNLPDPLLSSHIFVDDEFKF